MTDSPIIRLERFTARQYGLFTRTQARTAGVTDRVLAHRVATGQWERTLPTVFRIAAVTPTFRQRAFAGTLWSGGVVSHTAATRLWGFEDMTDAGMHIAVARKHGLRHPDIVVHTTRELIAADRAVVHRIPVTSALRTVLDVAHLLEVGTVERLIEEALRRRLFSVGQLRWRAETHLGQGVGGAATIATLLRQQDLGKTDSGWEVRVARILTEAGYPEPQRQLEIQTIDGRRTVDLAYPGPPVIAFEYDSDQWHSGVRRRHADAARRNVLRLSGCVVIEVTSDLARDPARLLGLVGPSLTELTVLMHRGGTPAR